MVIAQLFHIQYLPLLLSQCDLEWLEVVIIALDEMVHADATLIELETVPFLLATIQLFLVRVSLVQLFSELVGERRRVVELNVIVLMAESRPPASNAVETRHCS